MPLGIILCATQPCYYYVVYNAHVVFHKSAESQVRTGHVSQKERMTVQSSF